MGFFLGKPVVSLRQAPAWEWIRPVLHVLRQVVSVAPFNRWLIFCLANPSINACVCVCARVLFVLNRLTYLGFVSDVFVFVLTNFRRGIYTYMNVPMPNCRIAEWVLFLRYNASIRCILDFPSNLYVWIESWTAHSHETWLACSIR